MASCIPIAGGETAQLAPWEEIIRRGWLKWLYGSSWQEEVTLWKLMSRSGEKLGPALLHLQVLEALACVAYTLGFSICKNPPASSPLLPIPIALRGG